MKGSRQSNVSPVTGERYTRAYPGDAEDKRVAQLFTCNFARDVSRAGAGVTLAGTAPLPEARLWRNFLHWPGDNMYFVDWAKGPNKEAVLKGFEDLEREWPEAHTVHGDINDVIPELPMISLANLDFMGFDRKSAMACVQKTIPRLTSDGGVMSLTGFRGREVDDPCRSAWDVYNMAREIKDPALRRRVGVQRLVQMWANDAHVTLEWLGGMDYQHKNSPMSVMVWRRVPRKSR